ncbi:MAG: winged helix-turn-helix transcriptional regulator [Thermoplasmata archaeon]|nr:MAG: winged helix-turn-helix transcriptional regulator [Thermoplasmata archaeon]
MDGEELSLENQRTIFRYISESPGVHLRGLSEGTGIPLSTVRYHINFLEKNDIVISRTEGNQKQYFINGRISSSDRAIAPLLQQKRFRDIILFLLIRPGSGQNDVAAELGLKTSTTAKYMRILEDKGVVRTEKNGRGKMCYITDERRIVELLLTYRKSFWDRFVDNALEIYFER